MQGRSRSGWYQALIVLVIMAGSFAAALLVRQFRILEPLEFRAYDLFINLQPRALTNSTVVIIEITEADIQDPELQLDYPIWDNKLADLLQLLLAHNPAAIGLDLFRDIPVPRSGEYAQQLQEVFRTNDKIVATWKLPTEGESTGIPPPPVLRDRPSRLGFGDFPFDDKLDKMVRRGLLYASDGNNSYESLALQTALLFLANKGIVPEPLDDPMAFQLGKSTLRRIDKNHGCYINTDANGYQILLDFRGPLRFERRRYKEIVSGKLPMGAFYDRILLVGYTAESVRDELATPLRENQRGIEVQAQVVDQLLRAALHGDRPMAAWKEWEELAWIAVWCLLGGLVSARVRSAKWFCFWVSVPLPALFLVAWGLYRAGWWVPLAVPAFAFLLPVGTIAAWSVYRERALLKELRQWFESLVSPEIVEKVLDSPELYVDPQTGLPVPQNAIATVIFADLKGSVAIAEKMKQPQAFMRWLNEYMTVMTDLVIQHRGLVSRFFGDALLAVFGSSLFHKKDRNFDAEAGVKEDAVRAIECALEMEVELAGRNARWVTEGLQPVQMRVGINTGELMAGAIGSAKRMEYTVIGDSVNVAARLESLDKDKEDPDFAGRCSRILISEGTYAIVADRFTVKEVGALSLKGKEHPVKVFRVVGKLTKKWNAHESTQSTP